MKSTLFIVLGCVAISMATAGNVSSQEKDESTVSLSVTDVSVTKVFEELNRQTGYDFFYDESRISRLKVTFRVKGATLQQVLDRITSQTGLKFGKVDNTYTVIPTTENPVLSSKSQQGFQVTGIVTDNKNESMPGVNVTVKGTMTGVAMLHVSQYDVTF
ncbi:MAG: STN domain-containing protein [Bacteroidales bacterium]|nr:STN domain-containing protein [Bacteroidales bacterium]